MAKVADDSEPGSTARIVADQGEPAIVQNSGAASPFLLLGDHAGRLIPGALGDLGLSDEDRGRHIAWDIGVAGLGARLSDLLDATWIRQRYSRLVVDCNREAGRADAMPEVSDGSVVPGNAALSDAHRAARLAAVYAPYHARIAEALDGRGGRPTVVIALHSFTPVMAGFVRPWRFGVLHLGASAFSLRMLAALRAEDVGEVGDNEPYAMDQIDFTIPHHAIGRGLDYLELEVRQDLLADAAGQAEVAEMLARVLPAAL